MGSARCGSGHGPLEAGHDVPRRTCLRLLLPAASVFDVFSEALDHVRADAKRFVIMLQQRHGATQSVETRRWSYTHETDRVPRFR